MMNPVMKVLVTVMRVVSLTLKKLNYYIDSDDDKRKPHPKHRTGTGVPGGPSMANIWQKK